MTAKNEINEAAVTGVVQFRDGNPNLLKLTTYKAVSISDSPASGDLEMNLDVELDEQWCGFVVHCSNGESECVIYALATDIPTPEHQNTTRYLRSASSKTEADMKSRMLQGRNIAGDADFTRVLGGKYMWAAQQNAYGGRSNCRGNGCR
jgi:hypothetical protein